MYCPVLIGQIARKEFTRMSEQSFELGARVYALEQYKIEIEKRLHAAKAVAVVVGLAAFAGGAWINSIWNTLDALTQRTTSLESSIGDWEKALIAASEQLSTKTKELLDQAVTSLGQAANDKRDEISEMTLDALLKPLKDGSAALNLRKLTISNNVGNKVAQLGSDEGEDGVFLLAAEDGALRYKVALSSDQPLVSLYNATNNNVVNIGAFSGGGEGFVRVYDKTSRKSALQLDGEDGGRLMLNTSKGETRYLVQIQDDRPIANYRGSNSELSVALGVRDDNAPFIRFFDEGVDDKVLEILGDSKGASARLYSPRGKLILYAGPDDSGGDGLLNVFDSRGQQKQSYSHK